VLKPGSHSLSLQPSDFENVSAVKLFQEHQAYVDWVEAEKAEAAAQQQRKKDISNFLFPPPPGLGTCNILSSLSSSTAISSVISPRPMVSKRVHNNQQDALDESFNVDEAEEKENSSAIRVAKRKKQPVLAGVNAGTLLYSACHGAERSYRGYVFLITGGVSVVGGCS
jgi:hypothetical protein